MLKRLTSAGGDCGQVSIVDTHQEIGITPERARYPPRADIGRQARVDRQLVYGSTFKKAIFLQGR